MRFYFDTEFIDVSKNAKVEVYLLSIGIISESDATYHVAVKNAPLHLADEWVQKNVLPILKHVESKHIDEIRNDILKFVNDQCQLSRRNPEFWAYFADYDWTLFCSIFGGMLSLPAGWPHLCLDLKQEALRNGIKNLPKPNNAHDALSDAISVKDGYHYIKSISG